MGEEIRVSWNSVPGASLYDIGLRCPNHLEWTWSAFSKLVKSSWGSLAFSEKGVLEFFLEGFGDLTRSPETCDGGRELEFSVTSVFDGYAKAYNRSAWVSLSDS